MGKFIIYLQGDEQLDNIIDQIKNSPTYYDTIYVFVGKAYPEVFKNETNFKTFLENIKSIQREVVLVSDNIKLFEKASNAGIVVQNRVYDALEIPNVIIKNKKLGEDEEAEDPDVNYSLDNLGKKFDNVELPKFIKDKKQEISEIFILKKRIIIPIISVSLGLLLILMILIIPNSKVYVKSLSKNVNAVTNVIFAEQKANQDILNDSSRNVVGYNNVTRLYEDVITYQPKGKEFSGEYASGIVEIENSYGDEFALKKGTLLHTDGDMVFATNYYVTIPAMRKYIDGTGNTVFEKGTARVSLTALDSDIYNNVIGARGNVKEGTEFNIPKLNGFLHRFISVHAVNDFKGGTTKWRSAVSEEDIIVAKQKVQNYLFDKAQAQIIDLIDRTNKEKNEDFRFFTDPNFFKAELTSIKMPENIVGGTSKEFIITGAIVIKALSYDHRKLVEIMSHQLEGKRHPDMILSYIDTKNIIIRAFETNTEKNQIKAAVSIEGREDYDIFSNSSKAKEFRNEATNKLTNLSINTAESYLMNSNKVAKVQIKLWPPFVDKLPKLPGSIDIVELKE